MPENDDILQKLESLKDNTPFSVPEGYWSEFDARIKERITKEEHSKTRNTFRALRPQLALAASFAALFILSYMVFQFLIPEKEVAGLSENEIYAVLENEIDDLDETLLFESARVDMKQNSYTEFELTEQEILEYLAEESSDLDIYTNEF